MGKTVDFSLRNGIPRNLLINGGDGVSQRLGEAFNIGLIGTVVSSAFGFDRWQVGAGSVFSAGLLNISDPIGGPGIALSGRPQSRIQRYQVATAEGAPAAGQVKLIRQKIEGTIVKSLSAEGKPLLLSFWMNATPGLNLTMSCNTTSVSAPDRSYLMPFTTVSGWKLYQFFIPEDPGQTLHLGNGRSIEVSLSFHTGSNFQSSTEFAWQNGEFFKTPAESNFMATIGNFIEWDQIMLVPSLAPDPDLRFIPHSYEAGGELQAMQRYYEKGDLRFRAALTSGSIEGPVFFRASKRAIPLITEDGPTETANNIHTEGFSVNSTSATFTIAWTADAEF